MFFRIFLAKLIIITGLISPVRAEDDLDENGCYKGLCVETEIVPSDPERSNQTQMPAPQPNPPKRRESNITLPGEGGNDSSSNKGGEVMSAR